MVNTSRQRRAILIRNANSFDFGGAERFVVDLAAELAKHGWHPTVVSKHDGIATYASRRHVAFQRGLWWQRQDWSGKRLALFPLYVGWQLFLIGWYARLFWKLRPEVVHAQSRDDFIAATLAGVLTRRRVIWTDHADLKYIYQNVRVAHKNPVGKLVCWASRWATAITIVSNSERQLVQKSFGAQLPQKYTVVHNGTTDAHVTAQKRPAADKNAVVFCATSRLVRAKGIGELITAFEDLDHDANVRLWIVGDGPESATFKTQASQNPRITFWGFQPDALPILAAADVFVHPSYHEGFSLSVVEGAQLGKPIIACDSGGTAEIVTNNVNGLLVPPKDADALAAAMRQLATNAAKRARFGTAARQTYLAHFQFDAIVTEEFLPLYEKK